MIGDFTLVNDLKQHDRERLWCSLFARSNVAKEACLILLGLQREWQAIPHKVTDPMIGLMRLKWWDDALAAIEQQQTPPPHPLIGLFQANDRLDSAICALLRDSVGGVEATLHEQPIPTLKALEEHMQTTTSSLHLVMLHALVDSPSPVLQKCVSHIGAAWGLTNMLRALTSDLARNHCLLPQDLMQKQSISLDNFGSEAFKEGCATLVEAITACAQQHVTKAEELLADIPADVQKQAAPVLLIRHPAQHYLTRITAQQYDVLTHIPRPLSGLYLLKLWWLFRTH